MKKLKIGLAGLGTVGKGVYDVLQKDAKLISLRSDAQIDIVAASARTKKNFLDSKIKFYQDTIELANDPEVDVIVEVIGGDGIAKELIEKALKNGKKVVTANKALIAGHGFEIAELAEKNGSYVGFEASTAGANPIIKSFKEGFSGNEFKEFYAILNGTCNFILTKMQAESCDFADALKEAQELGYAEADPTLDVNGADTAHKLTILAAIGGLHRPNLTETYVEGIQNVSLDDVKLADDLGYKIKLLAIYKNFGNSLQQVVYPSLIKNSEKLAQVDGVFNSILSYASNAGWSMIVGHGAGGLATASAIVSDLIDIACGRDKSFLFNTQASNLSNANIEEILQRTGKYFIRLIVCKDQVRKSTIAEEIFGDKIKLEQATFVDRDNEILCGFLTKEHKESNIVDVLKNLSSNLVKSASFLRVEETNF